MAVEKFSQIPLAPSPPLVTDYVVGVTSGNVDQRYSLNQINFTIKGLPLASGQASPPLSGSQLIYYVSTTGSDSNNGFSPGTAFATLAHAVFVATGFDYTGGFTVTINIAAGTYTSALQTNLNPVVGTDSSHDPGIVIDPAGVTLKQTSAGNNVINCQSGDQSGWGITTNNALTLDSGSGCASALGFSFIIFNGTVTLQDSSGGHDSIYLATFYGGQIFGGGYILGNNDFNTFWGATFVNGSDSLLSIRFTTIVFPAVNFGASATWINQFECGSNTYKQEHVTYTNFSKFVGQNLFIESSQTYILTTNGTIAELPGTAPSGLQVDLGSIFGGTDQGGVSRLFTSAPFTPGPTDVATNPGETIWKDTLNGPRYQVVNDGGVLYTSQIGHNVNAQTGASYTLQLFDQEGVITTNNAGANTITVPLHASVSFPTGTKIDVLQLGAGATTIAAAIGVTLNNAGALAGQFKTAVLFYQGADVWTQINGAF